MSFSTAYGYQISNFNRIQVESPDKIDWNSDSWLSSDMDYRFAPDRPYSKTADGGTSFELVADNFVNDDVLPAVPEPTITILFGLGLGTMALYRKLRH